MTESNSHSLASEFMLLTPTLHGFKNKLMVSEPLSSCCPTQLLSAFIAPWQCHPVKYTPKYLPLSFNLSLKCSPMMGWTLLICIKIQNLSYCPVYFGSGYFSSYTLAYEPCPNCSSDRKVLQMRSQDNSRHVLIIGLSSKMEDIFKFSKTPSPWSPSIN